MQMVPFPLPLILHCPTCKHQHVDKHEGDVDWSKHPHKSHKCAACGTVWRPADVPTVGVSRIGHKGLDDTWPA